MKRIVLAVFLLVITASTPAYAADVSIEDNSFSPEDISIDVGESVTWTHNGNNPHTVTENNEEFDSGTMASGQTFSHTFNEAGTYNYFCEIHGSSMSGTVTVSGDSPTPSPSPGDDGGATSDGADDGSDVEQEEIPRAGVSQRTGLAGLALIAAAALLITLTRSGRASARLDSRRWRNDERKSSRRL